MRERKGQGPKWAWPGLVVLMTPIPRRIREQSPGYGRSCAAAMAVAGGVTRRKKRTGKRGADKWDPTVVRERKRKE